MGLGRPASFSPNPFIALPDTLGHSAICSARGSNVTVDRAIGFSRSTVACCFFRRVSFVSNCARDPGCEVSAVQQLVGARRVQRGSKELRTVTGLEKLRAG